MVTAMVAVSTVAILRSSAGMRSRVDRQMALQQEARAAGIERLFVLTTQATHWFKERGFEDAGRQGPS